jgi:ABC-2 type transport system ATP-binding protein
VSAETERPVDLSEQPGIHGLRVDGARVDFEVDDAHLDAAVKRLGEGGVRSLTCHPPTLEELFLRHYGDQPAHERVPPRTGS